MDKNDSQMAPESNDGPAAVGVDNPGQGIVRVNWLEPPGEGS